MSLFPPYTHIPVVNLQGQYTVRGAAIYVLKFDHKALGRLHRPNKWQSFYFNTVRADTVEKMSIMRIKRSAAKHLLRINKNKKTTTKINVDFSRISSSFKKCE